MNYVCYTTDKFMNEKYDAILEHNLNKNIVPMAVKESSDYEANAAHPINHSSIEDKAFDEDIMNSEDF